MIEQGQRPNMSSSMTDLEALGRKASKQRDRHKRTAQPIAWNRVQSILPESTPALKRLPTRLLLHTVVALVLPVAILLSQLPPGTLVPAQQNLSFAESGGQAVVALAPVALSGNTELGDAPLPDDANIPVPLSLISLSEALAPVVVPASVLGERVNLRNGPGTEYDVVARISGDAPLQVIGRYGDWFQVRERADKPVMWISGELLNISGAAASTLFEVMQKDVPLPPPPKIGQVTESGLLLRDGPGTNYVPITSLQANTNLELIEIYRTGITSVFPMALMAG